MDFEGLSLVKVNESTELSEFDCGNEDLNEFLTEKAIPYSRELLATTYILRSSEKIIAYFSIFNDSIRAEQSLFPSKSAFKRFLARVSHPKRHLTNFPAIKIGRLAVCTSQKKNGLGKAIISFVIDLAVNQNALCACKFITVDAYEQSLGFYERMGFTYLTENDKLDNTRQMFLDLTPYINAMNEVRGIQ